MYHLLREVSIVMKSSLKQLNSLKMHTWIKLFLAFPNCCPFFAFIAIQEQEIESVPLSLSPDISLNKSQLDDCPRDSGCYISSENSDNGKEDLESENLSDMVQKISITEPSDWTHFSTLYLQMYSILTRLEWKDQIGKEKKCLQILVKLQYFLLNVHKRSYF